MFVVDFRSYRLATMSFGFVYMCVHVYGHVSLFDCVPHCVFGEILLEEKSLFNKFSTVVLLLSTHLTIIRWLLIEKHDTLFRLLAEWLFRI